MTAHLENLAVATGLLKVSFYSNLKEGQCQKRFTVLCLVAQLCMTLCNPARLLCPWGFPRQEYWSGLPCPSPGYLPKPGIEARSPALQLGSLQSEPPGKPDNVQTVVQLHSFQMLLRLCSKSLKLGFSIMWTGNCQMYKLDLEKAEKPEIKLPTSIGS